MNDTTPTTLAERAQSAAEKNDWARGVIADVPQINSVAQLKALAAEHGASEDWHHQPFTALVTGKDFENAGFHNPFRPRLDPMFQEQGVTLYVGEPENYTPVAVVNLATLFAFACGYEGRS